MTAPAVDLSPEASSKRRAARHVNETFRPKAAAAPAMPPVATPKAAPRAKAKVPKAKAPTLPTRLPGGSTAARRTVIGLMAFAVLISLLRSFVKGPQGDALRNGGRPRIVVGGLVGTVFLLFISDWAPKVATGFAVVVATTATLTAGPETIDAINPNRPRARGPIPAPETLATYAPGAAQAAYDPTAAINSYVAAAAPGAAPVAPVTARPPLSALDALGRIRYAGGGGQGGGGGGGGSW